MAAFDRDQENYVTSETTSDSDRELWEMAEKMHKDKNDLLAAIKSVIHPVVVRVITPGWEGTGFYLFQDLLVSCAHVLPSYEVLSYSRTSNSAEEEKQLEFIRAFIRPVGKSIPDVILVETSAYNVKKGLPLSRLRISDAKRLSGDEFFPLAEGLNDAYYFYTIYDTVMKKHVTNFITETPGQENKLPLTFDGHPIPGSSGAPVFKARVLVDDSPEWDFELIGILYGDNDSHSGHSQLYVMPIWNDWQTVREDILGAERLMQLYKEMASASKSMGLDSSQYSEKEDYHKYLKNKGLEAYQKGKTLLRIFVDQCKLLRKKKFQRCTCIAPFKSSMLLQDQQNLHGIDKLRLTLNEEDLKAGFGELILGMTDTTLTERNEIKFNKFFRIDCHGPGSDHWKLELQDNTGDPTYSQTFAIVTIPSSTSIVMGGDLAVALVHSALKKAETSLKTIVSPQYREFATLIKSIHKEDEIHLETHSIPTVDHFKVDVCKGGEEVGLWMVAINKNSTETQHVAIVITSKPTVKGRDLAATLVHSALKKTATSLKTITSSQQSQSQFANLIKSIRKEDTISLETHSFPSDDHFRIDVCKGEKVGLWMVGINKNGSETQHGSTETESCVAIVTTSICKVTGARLADELETSARELKPQHIYYTDFTPK